MQKNTKKPRIYVDNEAACDENTALIFARHNQGDNPEIALKIEPKLK